MRRDSRSRSVRLRKCSRGAWSSARTSASTSRCCATRRREPACPGAIRRLWMSRISRARSIADSSTLGLESLAYRFGVTIEARHDALGDSLAAAEIFAALVPRLREVDVRTLGEAEAFAARRTDLVAREVEAGWHSMPGESPEAPSPQPLVRVDSFLYLRRLDEVMSTPRAVDSTGRDDSRSRPNHDRAANRRAPRPRRGAAARRHRHRARSAGSRHGPWHRPRRDARCRR